MKNKEIEDYNSSLEADLQREVHVRTCTCIRESVKCVGMLPTCALTFLAQLLLSDCIHLLYKCFCAHLQYTTTVTYRNWPNFPFVHFFLLIQFKQPTKIGTSTLLGICIHDGKHV